MALKLMNPTEISDRTNKEAQRKARKDADYRMRVEDMLFPDLNYIPKEMPEPKPLTPKEEYTLQRLKSWYHF